jgi:hypothetical protein
MEVRQFPRVWAGVREQQWDASLGAVGQDLTPSPSPVQLERGVWGDGLRGQVGSKYTGAVYRDDTREGWA